MPCISIACITLWIAGLSDGRSIGPLSDYSLGPQPKYTTELLYHCPSPLERGWGRLPSSLAENGECSCGNGFTFTTVALVSLGLFLHTVDLFKFVFWF